MSASLSESNSVAMVLFDSYSKTVMRNLSRDEIAKINKQIYHEIGGTEVMKFVTETYGKEDTYPSEFVITGEHGHSCEAMIRLKECQKEVLILEFWYGLSRREVADLFNVSERTISKWKRKAFNFIRDYYERE